MPRGDRTGPLGEGPMTGRKLGYGAGYDSPGYTQGQGMGRGFFGRGRAFLGRGRGNRYFRNRGDAPLPEDVVSNPGELNSLHEEVKGLKSTLSAILDRLKQIEQPGK